jgi:sugar phosphate isomerase/epimerase
MHNSIEEDISISTIIFEEDQNNSKFPLFLDNIQKANFKSIEISGKHVNCPSSLRAVKQSGLKVWSVHGSFNDPAICIDETRGNEAVQNEIRRMNNLAVFAPCPYVIHYLDRFNNPDSGVRFRRYIEELYIHSTRLGFNLSIETVPYKPEYFERSPDSSEVSNFVRSFNCSDLSITFDVNHSNLHDDFPDACNNCCGLISNVHLSDNYGLREEHLIPGKGVIDFKTVCNSLRQNGYKGKWNLEVYLPKNPEVTILQKIRNDFMNLIKTPPIEKK